MVAEQDARLRQALTVVLVQKYSIYRVCQKKTGPFVISSYLCFDSYGLHEHFQKYIGGVTYCEY